MLILVGVVIVFVPLMLSSVLLSKLRAHRIDLRSEQSIFEGRSRVWQANVFRGANYDAAGRRLLRWYFLALAVQAIGFAIALTLLYRNS